MTILNGKVLWKLLCGFELAQVWAFLDKRKEICSIKFKVKITLLPLSTGPRISDGTKLAQLFQKL
jgi:hypothetical protein